MQVPATLRGSTRSRRQRLRDSLPQGNTLPENMWRRRHIWLLTLLWLHLPAVFTFALAQNNSVGHSAFEAGVLGVAAAAATWLTSRHQRAASLTVAFGLLTCSATVTHLSGGYIEAHFHFFVVVTLLVLYEDWSPFLLAIGYVLLHHGLGGLLMPERVYNHQGAQDDPWKWAAIHAGFIAALSVGSVVSWRLNEDGRAEAQEAQRDTQLALEIAQQSEERFRNAFANAPIGMALFDADPEGFGRFVRVNRALCEITGFTEDELLDKTFQELTHPEDREKTDAAAQALLDGTTQVFANEKRYLHADGHPIPTLVTSSLMRGEHGDPDLFICQIQDITERKRVEEQLAHQALHDTLTALPNRALFRDRVRAGAGAHRTARREHQPSCSSTSTASSWSTTPRPLDRRRAVLQVVSRRIQTCSTDRHGLALRRGRVRGALRGPSTAAGDVEAIASADRRGHRPAPRDRAAATIVLSGSIGSALCDDRTPTPTPSCATRTPRCTGPRRTGGGRISSSTSGCAGGLQRVETEHALRRALDGNEFVLHYQPIMDLATGEIDRGRGARCAGTTPSAGCAPDEFIPSRRRPA